MSQTRMGFHAKSLAGIGLALLASGAAWAGPVQVTDRASLTGETIDWSAYGAPGADLSTPDAATFGSLTAQIGSSAGVAEIRREGTDFTGDFARGDTLLSLPDGYKSDVFGIRFSGAPVYAVGTQIEPVGGYLGAFTGFMDLYSATNTLLGEISVKGDATTAENGSATFLGASSSIPISYIRFFVNEGDPFFPREGDLAINELSLGGALIPEPAGVLLLLVGVAGTLWVRGRKRFFFEKKNQKTLAVLG